MDKESKETKEIKNLRSKIAKLEKENEQLLEENMEIACIATKAMIDAHIAKNNRRTCVFCEVVDTLLYASVSVGVGYLAFKFVKDLF